MEKQNLPQQEISEFLKQFEGLLGVEERLRACIHFMGQALNQKGSPNFRNFWEVRKICFSLFKEPLLGAVRAQFWADYIELTREGRRLKSLLDEESAFAVEQIDLAIIALEDETRAFHEDMKALLELKKVPKVVFPDESTFLQPRYPYYQGLQRQLNMLNAYASRINTLRKELIRFEMRIRQKNQFFLRLSHLGDQVFPMRKELIREVSQSFTHDVEAFIEEYFSPKNFSYEKVRRSVIFFRNEIKALQSIAKILTLNTHAFSSTREQLSSCWDQLKGMEKEIKKEHAQQKQKSGENAEKIQQRIAAFVSDYAKGTYSLKEGFQELETINRWMREVDLTYQHVRMLKEELAKARQPLGIKRDEEQEERRQKQIKFEQMRRKEIEKLKQDVESLFSKVETADVETLFSELEVCRKVFNAVSMIKMERHLLDRRLKQIRDRIAEKREQALIDLSEDDRHTLDNLTNILTQRKERRKEVKQQIEEYRKISGGSGLDFEKSMRIQELMNQEKGHLNKLDEGIGEIERKIHDLKQNT